MIWALHQDIPGSQVPVNQTDILQVAHALKEKQKLFDFLAKEKYWWISLRECIPTDINYNTIIDVIKINFFYVIRKLLKFNL